MAAARPIVIKSTKEFAIPPDDGMANLVPMRPVVIQGAELMAFPHTTETTRLARNLGHAVPAPILTQYTWPTTPPPFETQKITAALLTMNARAYVLSEMGTGKTRAALFSCDHMFGKGEIRKVLVVAPLSTLTQVWDREIYQYFPHLRTAILHGTKAKRLAALNSDAHVFIINHDGVKTIWRELQEAKFDVVIVDEIGVFRNKTTRRWRFMHEVVKDAPYAWGMTGSPTPNEPPDAWGIAQLLTPSRAPKYKNAFIRKTMTQITQFKWLPKPDANEHVYEMLQPAVRFRRDDCVELPDVSYTTIKIEQSKQIQDVYSNLMKKLKLAFQEGVVTAANEGVLFSKLLQISSGWVYTQDKGVVPLDNTSRVQELLDIYEQSIGKVICFTAFTHGAEELYKRVMKKTTAMLVHGGTPKKQRDAIFGSFMNSSEKQLLIAHPQCMAHGLTLTSANTIVWFTPTTSLEIYEQANARITRPGQTHKALIVHLTGSPIESKIYSRLRSKATVQGALLDMFNDDN